MAKMAVTRMSARRRRGGSSSLSLARPRTQREVIRDVVLSAGQCATWLTLDELSKLTQYPPASISAQLRHLRKRLHGALAVVKRCRAVNRVTRREGLGPLWEYAVQPVVRECQARSRRQRRQAARAGKRTGRSHGRKTGAGV
jgi:hypothetical protein